MPGETVATVPAPNRVYRNVELAQMLDITANGTVIHPKTLGELSDRTSPTSLQQLEQGQHSCGRSRHAHNIAHNTGRKLTPIRFTVVA